MELFGKTLSDEQLAQEKLREDQVKLEAKYNRYDKRFNKNQPWIVRNQSNYSLAKVFSYVCNLLSALGFSWAAIIMLEFLPIPYLNYVIGFIILVSFEYLKRMFSDRFWDVKHAENRIDWTSLVINFIVLFGLSLAGTAYGVFFFAKDNDPGAAQLRAELERVENKIEGHESNRNKDNEIYWKSQEKLDPLYAERTEIKNQIKAIEGEQIVSLEDNSYIMQKAKFRQWGALLLALILEIMFEICMSFMSKFDFLRYRLAQQTLQKATTAPTLPGSNNDLLIAQLLKEIEQLRAKISDTYNPDDNPPSGTDNNRTRKKSSTPTKRSSTSTGTATVLKTLVNNRTRTNITNRTCSECTTDISNKRSDAKTCSAACRKKRKERLTAERQARQQAS